MHLPPALSLCGWLWIAWFAYWLWAARRSLAPKWTESTLSRLQHTIPLALGLYLIFGSFPVHRIPFHWRYPSHLGYLGALITAIGLGFAIWARLHLGLYWSGTITLKQDHRIIRTGPYRLVRHPVYTGLITAAAGSALAAANPAAFLGLCVIIAAMVLKLRREERLLTTEFGDEYLRFKREVPTLFPFIY